MNETKEKLTVLIAEDQKINREILKGILRQEYNVLEANNGEEALDLLKSHENVSAILTDLMMPKMDGYAFLAALQKSPYANIPSIAVTGEKDVDTEQKALDLGAWDFVNKPYQPMTLLTRLKNVIVRSQFYLMDQMRHIYEHDALTGLYNRSHFFERARALLDANPQTTFAFVRFDIRHFQAYNSFWGEEGGDSLLKYIAAKLGEYAAAIEPCVYARINADVFCLCAPYRPEKFLPLFNQAKDELNNFNGQFRLIPSFGVYVVEDPKENVQKMYELATLASKEGKKGYEATYTYYKKEMTEKVVQNQWIVNEMQRALEEHQFVAYYQPKYSLQSEKPFGAEALVRWKHPEKGLLSPGLFIPVFEQNGFIGKLDYYMWEEVCRSLKEWRDQGLSPAPVSVNVSRVNLYNPRLVESLVALLESYHLPHSLLQLEVTESAYMDNPAVMEKVIGDLQKAGFTILMDDFGSGYSSLNTLKDIHIDILKIDLKFLEGKENIERSRSILASMIRMAEWLHTPVVMEGVETRDQVEFLQSLGCDFAQGYYYSRPIPREDYVALITKCPSPKVVSPFNEKSDLITHALFEGTPEMELLFQSLVDPSGIYEVDDFGPSLLRANSALQHYFLSAYGLDPHLPFQEQKGLSKDDAENLRQAFLKAKKEKATADLSFAIHRQEGEPLAVRVHILYWGEMGLASVLFAEYHVAA